MDWDVDKVMEEYGKGEKLTDEEERKLELDLAKYMYEFKMEEMEAENEKLKEKIEEMSKKAKENEVEIKRGEEEIKMLKRMMESSDMRSSVRVEEDSLSGGRVSRRSRVRCWDLTRPGGCQYGSRCRYLHPVEEVVRAEDSDRRVEGESRILSYDYKQMRARQDFPQARVRVRRMMSEQLYQQQGFEQQLYQQMGFEQQLYQQQRSQQQLFQHGRMNQQHQWVTTPTVHWWPQM